ncbi:MAG: serine/threonine protein kinase [Gemmataceae bacterium]|nr:serine/threonine protein kinase [Gemmataceae bacterium]
MPFSQVMKIGKEVCIGLAAAHAKGLIHRDINPSNLWLEKPHGRVKILDFGLARSNADTVEIAKVGEILGTPPFMAPEQAYGNPLDFHTDLFSLGCVLYWLTTGVLPFQAKDDFSTLVALSKDKSPSPKSICKDLPEEFSDLVLWLLEKVPTERPESAMAVFDKLSEIETRMANESKG